MSLILLKGSKHFDGIWVCIYVCTMQVLASVEYPEAFHTVSTSEMSPESGGVYSQAVILDRVVNKQKLHQQTVWILLIFQFCCCASHFSSGAIAKSQWHQADSPVFPPHPGKAYKPTGSQPNVFCMTASVCCSLHLTVSDKAQSCLPVKRESGKDNTGHLYARGARVY